LFLLCLISNALNINIHAYKLLIIKHCEKGYHGCMIGKDSKLTGLEFRKLSLEKQKGRQRKTQNRIEINS
jgi:hypothetical protein